MCLWAKEYHQVFPLICLQTKDANKVTYTTKGKVMLSIWLASLRKFMITLIRKMQSSYFEWYYCVQIDQSFFNVKNLITLIKFRIIAQLVCFYSQDINSQAWKNNLLLYFFSDFVFMGQILSWCKLPFVHWNQQSNDNLQWLKMWLTVSTKMFSCWIYEDIIEIKKKSFNFLIYNGGVGWEKRRTMKWLDSLCD